MDQFGAICTWQERGKYQTNQGNKNSTNANSSTNMRITTSFGLEGT